MFPIDHRQHPPPPPPKSDEQSVHATFDGAADSSAFGGGASAAGSAVCYSPPKVDGVGDTVPLELSLNAQQFTADQLSFVYYIEASLLDVMPRSGPVNGGTQLEMSASSLANGTDYRCRLGEQMGSTPATWDGADGHGLGLVRCDSAPLNGSLSSTHPHAYPAVYSGSLQLSKNGQDYGGNALQFTFYHEPVVVDYEPKVNLRRLLLPLPPPSTMIRPLLPISPPDSPPTHPPKTGSLDGGTLVRFNGTFGGGSDYACRFGEVVVRATHKAAPAESLRCESPPQQFDVGAVTLSISPNAQQWASVDEGGGELLYEYYGEPIYAAIHPLSGPLDGDTLVRIPYPGLNETFDPRYFCRFGAESPGVQVNTPKLPHCPPHPTRHPNTPTLETPPSHTLA